MERVVFIGVQWWSNTPHLSAHLSMMDQVGAYRCHAPMFFTRCMIDVALASRERTEHIASCLVPTVVT